MTKRRVSCCCLCVFLIDVIYFGSCHSYAQNTDGFLPLHEQLVDSKGVDGQSLSYCRISTRDLIATAESTANRVLKGVCNPRELSERFSTLEAQIVDQFNVLKTMVLNVEDKLRDQDERIKGQHRKLHKAVSSMRSNSRTSGSSNMQALVRRKPSFHSGGHSERNEEDYVTYEYYDDDDASDAMQEQKPSARAPEVIKYNSSIHTQDGKRVFTYYWTVRDMTYRIKNWGWRRSLRSDSFYIFQYGYRMYLRIYPNQNGKNIYIHVGLTQGDYDSALDWPFKLRHKIQVLDHEQPGEDMSSRIWDPSELCSGWNWRRPDPNADNYECVGLGFPHDTLNAGKYLHNDSLTVKLTVFLD